MLILEFDGFPPTVNTLYRSSKNHLYKQKAIREWQEEIAKKMIDQCEYSDYDTLTNINVNGFFSDQYYTSPKTMKILNIPYNGRVAVIIDFFVSNKRRWDIDNRIKSLLDCLEMSGIIENDCQIDALQVTRHNAEKDSTRIILMEYIRE